MELGSVAEVVSALASLFALIAAGIAARAAVRTNQQQGVQLAHLATDEANRRRSARAAQASRIAAWVLLDTSPVRPRVCFANPTDLPVYAVTVVVAAGSLRFPMSYSVLAPGESVSRLRRLETDMVVAVAEEDDESWTGLLDAGQLRAGLTFRDAQGIRWIRDLDGGLYELESDVDSATALRRMSSSTPPG